MDSLAGGKIALEFYSEAIKEYLIPSQVLPYLASILTESETREIFEKQSNQEACTCLLAVLSKSTQLGWYRCFLQALRLAEFDLLADIIEGHADIKNQEVFKNLMKVFYPNFYDTLDPCDVLPHLLQMKCISDADFEYIQRVHDTRGRYSATLVLLPIVAMKKRGWFPSFMHALKDTGYHHLVEAVAPEFISQDSLEGDQLVASKIEETVSRETGGDSERYVPFDTLMRMHSMPDLLGPSLPEDFEYSYTYCSGFEKIHENRVPNNSNNKSTCIFSQTETAPTEIPPVFSDSNEAFDEVDFGPIGDRNQSPPIETQDCVPELAKDSPQYMHKLNFSYSKSYPPLFPRVHSVDSVHPTDRNDCAYHSGIGSHRRNNACSEYCAGYYNCSRLNLRCQKWLPKCQSSEDIAGLNLCDDRVFGHRSNYSSGHSYYNLHSSPTPRNDQVPDHRTKWVPRPPKPSPRCKKQNRNTAQKQGSTSQLDIPVEAPPIAPPRRKRNNKRPSLETQSKNTGNQIHKPVTQAHKPQSWPPGEKNTKHSTSSSEESVTYLEFQPRKGDPRKGNCQREEDNYAEELKEIIDDSATAEMKDIFKSLGI